MQQLVVLAILFFLVVPGVLVSLPRGGSKYVVAATHAVVFVVLYFLLNRYVLEGFSEGAKRKKTVEDNHMSRLTASKKSNAYSF